MTAAILTLEERREHRKAYLLAYREANREHKRAYNKAYHAANKEEHREHKKAYNKTYYEANKEHYAACSKAWCGANKEQKATTGKAYREDHKEQAVVTRKAYYEAHKEQAAATQKAWNQTPVGRASKKMSWNKRRAAKRGAECPLTGTQWWAILEAFEHRCAYCGTDLDENNTTLDHVIPLILGGPHSAQNVVPACGACNDSKGAKPLEEWLGINQKAER